LHSFRNAYIVIRWAVTGDFMAVREEEGRADINSRPITCFFIGMVGYNINL